MTKAQSEPGFLHDVFNAVQDGISVLDPDLTVRSVNHVMNRWYSRNRPLEGQKCYRCYHDADQPCDRCPTIRCLQSGQTECEVVPGLPGSTVEWIELYSHPIKEPNSGEVTGVVEFVRDITQRKRAEDMIRESEERYKTLVGNAALAIAHFDADGRIALCNSAAAALLGLTEGQVIGKRLSELLPEELAQSLERRIQTGMREQKGTYREDMVQRPGGKRWFYSTVQPVMAGGKVRGVQVIAMDITARKQKEQELRESEEKYRLVVDNSMIPIEYITLDGRLQLINAIGARNLGGRPEQFIGRSIYEILPDMADATEQRLRNMAETGTAAVFEDWMQLPSGKRCFLTHFQPVKGGTRQVVGAQLMSVDMTARKKAEEELVALRNLLESTVNFMPSVLVAVDNDLHVVQWNREAERLTGVEAEQAKGRALVEVFPVLASQLDSVRQAITTGRTQTDERIRLHDDGDPRLWDVAVYPLPCAPHGIQGAVIRVDDVSERVRIEEMMIQSEKMVSVGGLAAGVAHEISNPLAGVLQSMEAVRNRISTGMWRNRVVAEECGTTIEAVQDYMKKRGIFSLFESARESGLRIAEIVDNVLSFSRMSEGTFAACDLRLLLDKTVELACSDADASSGRDFRKIEIERHFDPATPKIWCEPSKIQQVLLNLLQNGAQAMQERPAREGRPSRFILRLAPEGDMVRIEIQDDGPGMEEAVRRRVFEPFFSTKPEGTGTGLGLSIAYFIVTKNHGGTLTVDSVPGKGTTFIVRLPVSRKVG